MQIPVNAQSTVESLVNGGAPIDPAELPPEVQELLEEIKLQRAIKVEALGKEVAKLRDIAVRERKASGIETIWREDEEYYQGVDDANRATQRWMKSAGTEGGISKQPQENANRSTAFFNLTRQFCDAASARMGDILLPAGDWNFNIKPTPMQDDPATGVGDNQQQSPDREAAQKAAEKIADRGQLKIRDWLTECSYHTEVRKVIEDASILGTGILKGPVATRRVIKSKGPDGALRLDVSTQPGSKAISPWDFFPDPQCGDNIHNGNHTFERDRLTAKQLKGLKALPGYLSEQIDKVLDEGPARANYPDGHRTNREGVSDQEHYEVWYFTGQVNVDTLTAMKVAVDPTPEKTGSDRNTVSAVITLVNDTPIKAFINPLDTGEFPYDLMPWQRIPDCPWGVGVARQGRTPQTMFNAAGRALMDNAGLASGPQLILRQNAIHPADGEWAVTPRKVWVASEQADIKSVADAILAINIPMMQVELMAIMEQARKMMEESTGIFFIMQGQQGSAPDTVGGMELLHRNASAILRRLSRVFDERITERHIRRYNEWLQLHGPADCRGGDLLVEAIGSTALVEREIQAMQAAQMLQLAANPAFGLDPEKAAIEVLKAQRFIPEKWTMDEEKKKKLAENPPVIPAIEVAKINAEVQKERLQVEEWKTKVNATTSMHKDANDVDRDRMYNDSMAHRDASTAAARREELMLKKEIALLDYANKRSISLDQIKAELAKTSMTLREQRALASMSTQPAKQVATPVAEPPQHAADGRAFQE
jgi:hypothetical protein